MIQDKSVWVTMTYTRWQEIFADSYMDAIDERGVREFAVVVLDKLVQRLKVYSQGRTGEEKIEMPIEIWTLRYLDRRLTREEALTIVNRIMQQERT